TVKQMSANDSELPLAKVGQRQTTHTKSPVQLTLNGAFAFVEENYVNLKKKGSTEMPGFCLC
ncbi:MAG: hypothetical protein WBK19_12210, partial [Azonexus sp.]